MNVLGEEHGETNGVIEVCSRTWTLVVEVAELAKLSSWAILV